MKAENERNEHIMKSYPIIQFYFPQHLHKTKILEISKQSRHRNQITVSTKT